MINAVLCNKVIMLVLANIIIYGIFHEFAQFATSDNTLFPLLLNNMLILWGYGNKKNYISMLVPLLHMCG